MHVAHTTPRPTAQADRIHDEAHRASYEEHGVQHTPTTPSHSTHYSIEMFNTMRNTNASIMSHFFTPDALARPIWTLQVSNLLRCAVLHLLFLLMRLLLCSLFFVVFDSFVVWSFELVDFGLCLGRTEHNSTQRLPSHSHNTNNTDSSDIHQRRRKETKHIEHTRTRYME